jgi:NADH-quinone oxidoreductase subunit L
VGAYSLAIFHVVTHAFFKALLFLGAGCVIHALAGEQEMAKMGGLRKKMPVTFWTMLIGALALSGIPFTSGWYSKDAILAAVLAESRFGNPALCYTLYGLGVAAAFCTAFYIFRVISLTFFGKPRAAEEVQAHVHEATPVMTIPLLILAAGALLAGALWQGPLPSFLGQEGIERRFEHVHWLNLGFTTAAALGGLGLALLLYVRQARVPHPEASRRFLVKLSWNKFYIDDFYTKVVGYLFALGADVLHLVVDILLIDTLLVRGTAWIAEIGGRALRLLHTGFVNGYALGILGGAVVLLYWLLR